MTNTSDKTIAGTIDTSDEACERACKILPNAWREGREPTHGEMADIAALIRALCAERDELRANADMPRFVSETDNFIIHNLRSELSSLRAKGCGVSEEAIARAICCPGGCLRTDDCDAGKRTEEREQTCAVLALLQSAPQDARLAVPMDNNIAELVRRLRDTSSAEKISSGWLAYFAARSRHSLFDVLAREFKASGLTHADLAQRLGKTADDIRLWLAGPQNMETDTASALLFAMRGAPLIFQPPHPLPAKLAAPMEGEVAELVSLLRIHCPDCGGEPCLMCEAANALESLSRRCTIQHVGKIPPLPMVDDDDEPPHPPQSSGGAKDERPQGSNADEWAMFLSEHAGPNCVSFFAVQIAEAIEAHAAKIWAAFVGHCEQLEEDADKNTEHDKQDGGTSEAFHFYRGQKFAAKSIRRSVEHPKYRNDLPSPSPPEPSDAAVEAAALALMDELYDGRASLPKEHPAFLPIYDVCNKRARMALTAAYAVDQRARS